MILRVVQYWFFGNRARLTVASFRVPKLCPSLAFCPFLPFLTDLRINNLPFFIPSFKIKSPSPHHLSLVLFTLQAPKFHVNQV